MSIVHAADSSVTFRGRLYQVKTLLDFVFLKVRSKVANALPPKRIDRLHIGSGAVVLDGWTNIDAKRLPDVDVVLDVRSGLPFESVQYIFAEHFLEHLTYLEGRAFLRECRRVLAPEGTLRISTPNLDWVWRNSYHPHIWKTDADAVRDAFALNVAFHGWGHKFAYNKEILRAALIAAGFASITFHSYGRSNIEALNALERHATDIDDPSCPHVLIAEATGIGPSTPYDLDEIERDFVECFVP